MASGDTLTTLCSTALFHLGEAPLSSYANPQTPLEQQVVAQYPVILNSELRRRDWIFAIMRTAFSDPSTPAQPPAFNTYVLPTDCVRALRERDREGFRSAPEWWIEGRNVCSRLPKAPLIRYISNSVDPSEFDPLFVMVLTYKLALHCCEYVTQSSQKKSDLAGLYQGAITEAGKQNAWEQPEGSTHAPENEFSWLRERSNTLY